MAAALARNLFGLSFCLLFCAPTHILAADLTAREIVERATEAGDRNDRIARNYTFHERREERTYRGTGELASSKSETWDVTLLEGSEYRRLIARDDQPLSPKQEASEQKKLEKSIEKMRRETESDRAKRLRKIEADREDERRLREEVSRCFEFSLAAEEERNGVASYVIDAEPRPDCRPTLRQAKILPKLRGRLWVSKRDYGWVRVEVETIDRISFGWFLVRLNKGSQMEFTQRFVNDEVWLVDNWRVRFRARLGLVKGYNQEVLGAYSNFRKFSTDSRVVSVETPQ